MAFHHLILVASPFSNDTYKYCDACVSPSTVSSILSHPEIESKPHLSLQVIIIVGILAATFLIVSCYFLVGKCCFSWIISRRAAPQINSTPNEVDDDDDGDENQNPIHHIWYITTVGLEESVINSISVCKYNRGEGLIEGTECSVCLNEFHEGENVKLLPKCSHAFHLPCIDTWLRSHVNCPLCRANVVSNAMTSSLSTNPNRDSLDAMDETQMGNSETNGRIESDLQEEVEEEEEAELDADDGIGDIETGKNKSSLANCGFRVLSDLSDNHRSSERAIELNNQRSVSMNSLSTSKMFLTLTNPFPTDWEGSSSVIAIQSRGNKKSNSGEFSRLKETNPNQNHNIIKREDNYSKASFPLWPISMK